MTTDLLERRKTAVGPDLGPCPVIHTARLTLRPHRLSDADAIALSLGDYQVARMLSRVPVPYHRSDAVDWLVRQRSGASAGWTFAVTAEDEVHIGSVGIDLRHGRWHLGYWLNRGHWGRGYAGEAVDAAVDGFFRQMPDTVLHSGVFADNAGSLNLQKKLGFDITGCAQIYALARNRMVSHIETRLVAANLRRP